MKDHNGIVLANRRQFLLGAAAAGTIPKIATAEESVPSLVAKSQQVQLIPEKLGEFPKTEVWGFNGDVPGPIIRVPQGGVVHQKLENELTEATSIHWHGLRIPNAMDGVPGLTQKPVSRGESFNYEFPAMDAGTFWYHSHNRSLAQVARGLYGPLIVEETSPPDVDHDLIVVIDDWLINKTGQLDDDFENRHDMAHQGRLGNYLHSVVKPDTPVKRGDRIRLRFINVATDRIFPIEVNGVEGKIVALDGMPLSVPQELSDFAMAPAQRVDVIADVTSVEQVVFISQSRGDVFKLGEITVNGENERRSLSEVTALPPNKITPPNLSDPVKVTLTMEGGAMSRRMMRGMMTGGGIWAFNGQSGLSDDPLHLFERGQTARISLVNDTRFPHGIHLHGHHFFEVDTGGALGAFRDTTLVEAGETRDIILVFDNPGKWLMHCHMLGHQASGMKTWVDVS